MEQASGLGRGPGFSSCDTDFIGITGREPGVLPHLRPIPKLTLVAPNTLFAATGLIPSRSLAPHRSDGTIAVAAIKVIAPRASELKLPCDVLKIDFALDVD